MDSFDSFSNNLLEEAKRFLEKAKEETGQQAKNANLHSSLLLSISSLEAFINGIAEDMKEASFLNLLEKAFLLEKEVLLKNGKFKIGPQFKMSRLLERVELLFTKFGASKLDKRSSWWQKLNEGITLRNNLVHAKESTEISEVQIEDTLRAVLSCINNLFLAVYNKGLPSINMGLVSKLSF